MTVNVILITHNDVGNAMLETITTTFGCLPVPTETVSVSTDTDPDDILLQLKNVINEFDEGQGVLILTDLFGATPCNIASELQNYGHVRVVAGLNLPMLIRVMNYPNVSLEEMISNAIEGGKSGVMNCDEC